LCILLFPVNWIWLRILLRFGTHRKHLQPLSHTAASTTPVCGGLLDIKPAHIHNFQTKAFRGGLIDLTSHLTEAVAFRKNPECYIDSENQDNVERMGKREPKQDVIFYSAREQLDAAQDLFRIACGIGLTSLR
jgi:hypothetical protein